MSAKKIPTINKFMDALVNVPGFNMTIDELKAYAAKIPRESGVRPVNQREGVRAKTPYNHWCATHWKEYCQAEYGRTLPLADLKYTTGDNKGDVKVSAHTTERKNMWKEFQDTPEFQTLKIEVDLENEKLGKISSKSKSKSTKTQEKEEIELLNKQIAEAKEKLASSPTKAQDVEEVQRLKEEIAKAMSEESDSDEDEDEDTDDDEDEDDEDNSDSHKIWVSSQFKKPTELNCFKAWIMYNDPETYGKGKKKAISREDFKELKDVHNLDEFSGNNYTEDCLWFEFINSN